ncbi:MAG TPA: methylcrotonoyl-CoA carboxylase, partial [Methylomirabilota bacterium]|nr:methylcrotonoyl-CoA carboxylase [Methylomirabilota bacterium]
MAVLRSALDPASATFVANDAALRSLVDDLRARTRAVSERGAGGDERSITRHRERGKMPVRERIDRLIDPGSAFL